MNKSKVIENQNVVFALASTEQAFYAGRPSGVFRSLDMGRTWHNVFDANPPFQGIAATALAIHNQTVFAGVKGAVVRSENGGDRWESAALSSPAPLVVDMAISPHFDQDQSVVAATAEDGVFVSYDRGMNWTAWNFGLIDLNCNCVAVSPDRMVFVGTESGIFYSHNFGKTWRDTPFPMDVAPVMSLCIKLPHIWAGTEVDGLYVSGNNGQTWAKFALLESSDESINALLPTSDGVMILTDHRLLQCRSDDFSYHKIRCFQDRQALTLAQIGQQIAVGFADGEIQVHHVK